MAKGKKMSFAEATVSCFKNYGNFNGRARRSEYWKFVIVQSLVWILILGTGVVAAFGTNDLKDVEYLDYLLAGGLGTGGVLIVYNLVTVLPMLAVTCRRLHDTDHSGAFIFLVCIPVIGEIILLIWLLSDGTPGKNRYGEDPKERIGVGEKICVHCKGRIDSHFRICPYCGEDPDVLKKPPVIKICQGCGSKIEIGETTCPHCGYQEKIPAQEKCPHCGKYHPKGSETCPHCGKLLREKRMKICPKCGSRYDAALGACPECVRPSEDELNPKKKICSACGGSYSSHWKVCPHCGAQQS